LETACRNYARCDLSLAWRDYAERAQRFDDEFESLIDAT
jgi:hypothetical protein